MFRERRARIVAAGTLVFSILILASPALFGGPVEPNPGEDQASRVAFSLSAAAPPVRNDLSRGVFSISLPRQSRTDIGSEPDAEAPARMNRRWGRAFLEYGVLFSYSAVNYWLKYANFIEDWQYELTCRDQFKRFFTTEAQRFDSNSFYLNWSHAGAGWVYYQYGRSNYLSWAESWLFATAGSLMWEYGVEWREVVSINDNVFTGLGAYAFGESWFQLASYLNHRPQALLKALGFINPWLKLNRWLDRKKPASRVYVDPGRHDFEILIGGRRLSDPGLDGKSAFFFSLRSRIIVPPEYGRPGRFRKTLKDTFASEISLDFTKGAGRSLEEAALRGWAEEDLAKGGWADEINFSSRVVGWSRFSQSFDELARGWSFSFGLGSAFSYSRKTPVLRVDTGEYRVRVGENLQLDKPRYFRDKISVVHMAGPVIDWSYFARDLRLRAVAEAYADMALVNAYALNEYSRFHDISGVKTTLLHYGYYYAAGGSLRGELEIEWRRLLRLRTLVTLQAWDSIEGLDRFQDDITDDCDVDDSRIRYVVGADWRPFRSPLGLYVAFEGIRRRGRIRDVTVAGLETRLSAGLMLRY